MPTLMFDPEAMHRAILNIVTNAVDACLERDTRRVEVSTHYDHNERMARVRVTDNGSGIEKDDLERIFAVFVSRKGRPRHGTGLARQSKNPARARRPRPRREPARRGKLLHARVSRHVAPHRGRRARGRNPRQHKHRTSRRRQPRSRPGSRTRPGRHAAIMSGTTRFLDAESLRAATFVRHVELHDTLPSTNDRAIELVASIGLETPALIVARHQTAGRGRGQHAWWSAEGALTFSLILDTAGWGITQRDWPRLSLSTAVAVCDALTNFGLHLGIKWPNDVLVDGRKVCGILIESPSGPAPAKDRLVIGVGINVNNSWRDAPHDVCTTATALCDITGNQHDSQMLLVRFLSALEQRLRQLAAKDPVLPQAWQHLCSLTERNVVVDNNDRSIKGQCMGIADDGALLVQANFRTERIYGGSVRVS